MKLIKLSTDHYIVVDDSEIKGDRICCNLAHRVIVKPTDLYWANSNKKNLKVITHSTQPLEQINFVDEAEGLIMLKVKSISLQEVKELIGEVDVEKKLSEVFKKHGHSFEIAIPEFKKDLILLYNQYLEDNKDRKYTEEDIRKAWDSGREYANDYWEARGEKYMINFDNFIQSLQPQTEWGVEIVDGKIKLKQ